MDKKTMPKGIFIVIEGIDGTGKSTLASEIQQALTKEGYDCLCTFEPTNGKWGTILRESFTAGSRLSPEEETEIFIKDRREHVKEQIIPALKSGKIVICDRYYLSTIAYQGARGMDMNAIEQENLKFAPEPDLALILELPVETAIERITAGRGDQLNNFEKQAYLEQVAENFRKMNYPFIKRIDASKPREKLLEDALDEIRKLVTVQRIDVIG